MDQKLLNYIKKVMNSKINFHTTEDFWHHFDIILAEFNQNSGRILNILTYLEQEERNRKLETIKDKTSEVKQSYAMTSNQYAVRFELF